MSNSFLKVFDYKFINPTLSQVLTYFKKIVAPKSIIISQMLQFNGIHLQFQEVSL